MLKLIKFVFQELNYIFLHDRDEAAPVSDYIWWYGFLSFCLVNIVFWSYKLITF